MSHHNNKKLVLIIAFFIFLISLKSSNQWSTLPIGNDLFWWIIQILFLSIVYIVNFQSVSPAAQKDFLYIKIYTFWILICVIRGIFVAENYWEWKNLMATSFTLFLPLIAYLAVHKGAIRLVMKTWFKYGILLFILVLPFLWGDAVGKFLIPITFLSLFFPILSTKQKILLLLITVFAITFDITARSNVIKFTVPFLIGLLYYFRRSVFTKLFNSIRLLMLSVPFVMLILGLTNIFNVFKMDEYISGDFNVTTNSQGGKKIDQSLTRDTRTLLYVEVIESAIKNQYILFGRTPARGNDSKLFGKYNKFTLHTGKSERFANEVAILNIFTWLGLIGVVLYFLIFIKATNLAVNCSNNIFMKLIGINVSFRWAYGFVEDFSQFDLSNIFLWIMIGMCFSKSFREMSDTEMKVWVRKIFIKQKQVINRS